MCRVTILRAVLLIIASTCMQRTVYAQAVTIEGIWLNEERNAKIQIYRSSDKYYGKIVWLKNAYESDGKTLKKDTKNPDRELSSRPLLGIIIFSDFSLRHDKWEDGKIYDPKSGKTYSSQIQCDGQTMEVRGYIGIQMFGRTTTFTRVQ